MVEKENVASRCAYCGSKDIDYGSIVTSSAMSFGAITGMNVYYRSSKEDHIQVMFSCGTCLKCGHMEFYIDPKQIKLQREHYKKKK
jgi:predicted nucleic-acid-binding Zn-ribbon protein